MTTRQNAITHAAITALVAQVSTMRKADLDTLTLGSEIVPGVKYRDLKNWLKENPAPTVEKAPAKMAATAKAVGKAVDKVVAKQSAPVVEFTSKELKGEQLLIDRAKHVIKSVVKSPEGDRIAITEKGVRVPVAMIERNNRGNLRAVEAFTVKQEPVKTASVAAGLKAEAKPKAATGVRAVELKSSNLASTTFDKANKVLTVTFKNGNTYQYDGVGIRLFNEFVRAESHGKFFAANIKPVFKATKIGTADAPANTGKAAAQTEKPAVSAPAVKPKSEADEIKPSAIRDQVLFNGRKRETVVKVVRNGTSGRREAVCESGERFPLWQIEQDAKGKFRVTELSATVEANTVKGGAAPKENTRKPRAVVAAKQAASAPAPAPKANANPRATFTAPKVSMVRGSTFPIVKGSKSKEITIAKVVQRNEIRYAITATGEALPFDALTLRNGELEYTGKLTAAEFRAL